MRLPFFVIENPEKLQFIRNNRLNSCILEPGLREVFEGSIDADFIFRRISLVKEDARFVPGETLLFLDEIQECPLARTALKYLALDDRIDVIASGSLLGIEFKEEQTSIPVGYERQVEMHPLDFEEFLWAMGEEAMPGDIRRHAETLEPYPAHRRAKRPIGGYANIQPLCISPSAAGIRFQHSFSVLKQYPCHSMLP